jgi:2'-5' RNA ligase
VTRLVTGLARAFLAVVPPPAILRWTDSLADSAHAVDGPDDGLRWTPTEQRHLTLRFFGRVADPATLTESVAESFQRFSPFTLVLGGGGAFPDVRRASVLWVGVQRGRDELGELAAAVAAPDDRPYRAHLTLARARRARDVRAAIATVDACGESERWIVDEVVLFDSTSVVGEGRPEGAVHTEQVRFRLAG